MPTYEEMEPIAPGLPWKKGISDDSFKPQERAHCALSGYALKSSLERVFDFADDVDPVEIWNVKATILSFGQCMQQTEEPEIAGTPPTKEEMIQTANRVEEVYDGTPDQIRAMVNDIIPKMDDWIERFTIIEES